MYTFKNYLKKEFQKYCSDKNNIHGILDKINNRFYKLSHDYDYNNKDYTVNLLTKSEKEEISTAYDKSKEMKSNIDKIILNPEIAAYNNYKWIATLYKSKNTKIEIDKYTKDFSYLISLKKTSRFDYYINKMIKSAKDVIALEKIYLFLDNKEELFKLLFNKDNEYRLMANIEFLKDNYNNQLIKYFKDRFYEVVAIEKSRDNYRKSAAYIGAIYKLNDGEKIVKELVNELKNSEYSKRIALFDEINRAIARN